MTPPRPRRSPRKSDGQLLRAELSRDDDTFSVRTLIGQAAHAADMIEKLRRLTSGDLSEWMSLKLGPQVVSVIIDSPVRELRQLNTEIRNTLAEIHRQRAHIPKDPDDDDVLAGLDSDD